ncbi:hypothetical protein A0J61_07320 [Choanephora cucurbitarum]|uniref:Uncharacterized protein n=1 Tax=Choanephora cucurbitarum TaxID=101091 RepID=A0A1C7N6A1_9FUNG|nr:hypothetical protein A0J61_07320 [Choanephora cucurbitarum]
MIFPFRSQNVLSIFRASHSIGSTADSRLLIAPQPVTYRSSSSMSFNQLITPNLSTSANTTPPSIAMGKGKRRACKGCEEHNCPGKVNRKRYISPRYSKCEDETDCPGLWDATKCTFLKSDAE